MWRCRLLLSRKDLSQESHLYGFSMVCVRKCLLSLLGSLNDFSQSVHLYGLSSVWFLMCLFNLVIVEKAFSHNSHLYGLSSDWIVLLLAPSSSPFRVNASKSMRSDVVSQNSCIIFLSSDSAGPRKNYALFMH